MNKVAERIPEAASSPLFEFFGLRRNPFSISPDPHFLYETPLTEAASQQLVDGVRRRKGLILLTGEAGTGKTLLLHRLLDWLAEGNMPTALIFNSRVSADDLLDFILSDFGVACRSSLKSDKLISLHRWLLDQYGQGRTPVLMVDEAQGLPLRTLEEIRLLLNLETPRDKPLQVILAGQPELEEKLKRHELRQLRQRVTVRCRTVSLTQRETHSYVLERLRTSGAKERIFPDEATTLVYAYSRGIPRVINVLCEHSLINACADSSRVVDPRFVERAAQDCQLGEVESVGGVLDAGYPQEETVGDIGSVCGTAGMPDSVHSDEFNSTVLTAPPALDLESPTPIRDFSSGQVAITLEAQPASNWGPSLSAVVTEAPEVFSPMPPEMDIVRERRASSVAVVQQWPSASLWPARCVKQGDRLRRTIASLFQGWRASFSADARSTRRQLRQLLRRCTSHFRRETAELT